MKNVVKPLLAGALVISVLSACGSSGGGKETSGGNVKIEFFQNKPEAKASFDKLVDAFNKANPGITVTQVNPPDAETVLKTRVTKKDVPDVVGLGAADTYMTLAKSGLFEDFTGDPLLEKVQPAYLEMLKQQTGLTETNGIPFSANANGVIYNKAMFTELGLTVPKTWDEFIATAQKIKDSGKPAFYLTLKDSWTTLPWFNALESSNVGLDFFKKRSEGAVTFKDSFREVAEKQLKLLDFAQQDVNGKGYNDGNTAFAKGEAAMYLQGVWAIPEIQKANPKIDLGVFTFPGTNDAAKNKLVSGVDTLLTISKNSKHKEESKKFIAFLLEQNNAKQYITEQKAFPAVKGVTQDDPSVADLKPAFESGQLVDFADHYIPSAMKVDTIIQSYLQKKDIDAYLTTLDTEWDKVANRK